MVESTIVRKCIVDESPRVSDRTLKCASPSLKGYND